MSGVNPLWSFTVFIGGALYIYKKKLTKLFENLNLTADNPVGYLQSIVKKLCLTKLECAQIQFRYYHWCSTFAAKMIAL